MIGETIAIGIAIGDGLDLGCMALDDDAVALGSGEVGDHVIADLVDPMVVDLVVLAGDAVPADGAVVLGVLLDIAGFGVDEGLEVEGVGAGTACQHIVGRDGLVWIELAVGEFTQGIAFVPVRIVGDVRLAAVGLGDEEIVAGAAVQDVLAMAAIEDVASLAAREHVVAVGALQDIVAGAAFERVVAQATVHGFGGAVAGHGVGGLVA